MFPACQLVQRFAQRVPVLNFLKKGLAPEAGRNRSRTLRVGGALTYLGVACFLRQSVAICIAVNLCSRARRLLDPNCATPNPAPEACVAEEITPIDYLVHLLIAQLHYDK